eukprot:202179_1
MSLLCESKNDDNTIVVPVLKKCLIIVIANFYDSDMRKDAHQIILKAQQTRQYKVHSIMFEPTEITLSLQQNSLHLIILKQLNIDQDIKSYFDKVIILGHCNYYTINYENSYYNEPFLSHEPTSIHNRTICGLDTKQFSQIIQYLVKQLAIYHISLCCCESATKNVHLECQLLDELTEEEEYIYENVSKFRLNENIFTNPIFVNKMDEKDKHLFMAFKYSSDYAKLVNNLNKRKKKKNVFSISDQTLSVLDLISNHLNQQNILNTLEKTLVINALNGFGYYRHPQMCEIETHQIKCKLMNYLCEQCDEKDNGLIYNLDKEFSCAPLRNDCIYYSIKNREGVQWLIDKDDNNLHKNRNWCQFELIQILEMDCVEQNDKLKSQNDKDVQYNERYFVHRPHVIQYQFEMQHKCAHK